MGVKNSVQHPEVKLFNFINDEVKEGNLYFESCLKEYAKEKGTNLVRTSNTILGETTTIIGRLIVSVYLSQEKKSSWFVFVGYGEKGQRVYKCIYFN